MSDIVDNYIASIEAIFEHVGYEGRVDSYLISDEREMFWDILDYGGDTGLAFTTEEDLIAEGEYDYCKDIYRGRIYEGNDFTMVLVEDDCGGDEFFMILDNTNRRKIE